MAGVPLTCRLSQKCALKSLEGHRGCLCPECELHSHYFDPWSDDTISFVKICVENAWEQNAAARTVILTWHTVGCREQPCSRLTHTHTCSRTHVFSSSRCGIPCSFYFRLPQYRPQPHPPPLFPLCAICLRMTLLMFHTMAKQGCYLPLSAYMV